MDHQPARVSHLTTSSHTYPTSEPPFLLLSLGCPVFVRHDLSGHDKCFDTKKGVKIILAFTCEPWRRSVSLFPCFRPLTR